MDKLQERTGGEIKVFYRGAKEADPEFWNDITRATFTSRIRKYSEAIKQLEDEIRHPRPNIDTKKLQNIIDHLRTRINKFKEKRSAIIKAFTRRGLIGTATIGVITAGGYGAKKYYDSRERKKKQEHIGGSDNMKLHERYIQLQEISIFRNIKSPAARRFIAKGIRQARESYRSGIITRAEYKNALNYFIKEIGRPIVTK